MALRTMERGTICAGRSGAGLVLSFGDCDNIADAAVRSAATAAPTNEYLPRGGRQEGVQRGSSQILVEDPRRGCCSKGKSKSKIPAIVARSQEAPLQCKFNTSPFRGRQEGVHPGCTRKRKGDSEARARARYWILVERNSPRLIFKQK